MAAQMARPRARLAVPAAGAPRSRWWSAVPWRHAAEPPAVRANDGRIAIAMRDFRFEPQRLRPRGGPHLRAAQRAGFAHTFRVVGKEGR